METIVLKIQGMFCEACAGHVTKALQELSGIQSAEVSLANTQAVVIYDPVKVPIRRMLEAVADEGYEAAVL